VELQVSYLKLPNGKRIRLDMAVPHVRWAVEVDVHPDHLLLDGTTKDKQRDRWCHRIDWQVERVTELDILDLPTLCNELVELYHLRCEALRRPG
jgi:very-short-patch-repair endonuclease